MDVLVPEAGCRERPESRVPIPTHMDVLVPRKAKMPKAARHLSPGT